MKPPLNREKVTVVFQPSGKRGRVKKGTTLLQAAQELGVNIESVCGGNLTCGKCRVRLVEGPVGAGAAKSRRESLSPFAPGEESFISDREKEAGDRLACAARLLGPARIFVPEESRRDEQAVRKGIRETPVEVDPAVRACYVEMSSPALKDPLGDLERVQQALEAAYGLKSLTIDLPALQEFPRILRDARWKATILVWMDREIIGARPGRIEGPYGLALDIGTTTVAAYLCNLSDGKIVAADSMTNPQVSCGEDVMARITYSMLNPSDGLKRMKEAITEGINALAASLSGAAGIEAGEIVDLTVVGNTAMHHIFLGIDPRPLGLSPFTPAAHRSLDVKARDLGIRIHPCAYAHILPVEAGFVGADNVGVLIALEPHHQEEVALIIDVGTNGELVLGNRRRLISASCATGPALEGAHIQFGMRAAPGAIERVRIDPDSLEVSYKVIGREQWSSEGLPGEIKPKGICGSGVVDAVAGMFTAGVIEQSGRFNPAISNPRLRGAGNSREFILVRGEETSLGRDITISLADVRAVQLAKGALYAGAKVMMNYLGINHPDRVILAGAFGSYLDPAKAMTLGMFPDCDLKNVRAVGNAAGEGARLALLSRGKREEANRVAGEVEYLELTTSPEFQDEFALAMHIPHMRDAFPHLREASGNPED